MQKQYTPPHISIFLPNMEGGGVERIRLVIAHELSRLGCKLEFVLMQAKGQLLAEAQRDFPVYNLDCSRTFQASFALSTYLRRRRPDALLAANWPLTVIAPVAQRMSGHHCSAVVSEHNTHSLKYKDRKWIYRMLLRGSMALGYRLASSRVAVSRGVARDAASLSGLPRSAFSVINNPVTPRRVPTPEALELTDSLWTAPSGKRILSVASFSPQKNHSLLLRAFARISHLGAQLMLLGTGTEERRIRQLASNLGIQDRVIFPGFWPDPSPFYKTSDLLVLSSDYEGFGNVIVEALAQGLPVVSTDCPSGPAEILDNGRWGKLTPVGDASALAAAMAESLDTEHDRDALKCRATDFSPEIAAEKYLNLLLVAN